MAIEKGDRRGDIDEENVMKVLLESKDGGEGVWIKVVALHASKKEVIGFLMNQPLTPSMSWGQLVHAVEKDSEQIAEIDKAVDRVPNGEGWKIL